MSTYSIDDPREIGTSGLSGINTKDGRRRYTEQMGIPTTVQEYKMASAKQGANYAQPIYDSDFGYYNVDRKINDPNELNNLGDARGRNQSSFAQIANGTVKGAVLAATTIGNTLGTFFVGIPEAIAQGDFSKVYDNEVTRTMQAFNDWSEKQLPNFYTDDQRNNPMALRNIFSANTLGDKFIKNLGFSVGSALVGMGAGAAVRGISSIPKIAGLVSNASNASKSVATLLGAMLSAVGESSFEAKNTADEFRETNLARLEQEHIMKLNSIKEQYGNTEMYIPLLNQENENYRNAISEIEERSFKAGDGDFLMNMMILPATNYVQFGKMFTRGFKTAEKSTGNAVKDMIKGTIGAYDVDASKLKGLAKVAGRGLSEGTEEFLQQIATDAQTIHNKKYIDNIYDARLNAESQEETINFMKSLGDAILYTTGESSAWEQFLIGGLTGLTGIPMVRFSNKNGRKLPQIYMAGNAMSEYNDYAKAMNEASDLADRMNEVAAKKDYVKLFQGLVADRAFQNDMNIAAANGDAYNYKNAEFLSLANMVDMFTRTGRLNDLKTMVNESFDLNSDEDLQSIINLTTKDTENNDKTITKSGPFVENGTIMDISTQEGKDAVKKILQDKQKEILNTIEIYETASKRLDNVPGQNFTDDQRDELIWLQMQLENWRQRGRDITGEILPHLKDIRSHIATVRDAMSEANELDENDKYSNEIANADKYINFLDRIVNSDSNRAADLLFLDTMLGKNLNYINNIKRILNNFKDGFGVDKSDIESDIEKLGDLDKITTVYNRSKSKLEEYLKNPTTISKAREKVRNKAQKVERSFKGKNLRNKLNSAQDVKAFRDMFESAKEDPEIKKQILDEVKQSNQIARDYVELQNAREGVRNELARAKIEDAELLGDISDLLDQAFNEAPNAAYFTDPTAEAYQKTDYLVNKESGEDKIMLRHQKAISYISNILSKYKVDKVQADSLNGNLASEQQRQDATPTKTTEEIPSNEQGGANPEDISGGGVDLTFDMSSGSAVIVEPIIDRTNEPLDTQTGDDDKSLEIKDTESSAIDKKSQNALKDTNIHQYLQALTSEFDYTVPVLVESNGKISVNLDAFAPNKSPMVQSLLSYFKDGINYVNAGKLHIGDEVFIGMDIIAGERRLVAFIKNGEDYLPLNNISGYNSSSALSKNVGLKQLYDDINGKYSEFIKDENNKDKPFISDITTHVADIMLGKIPFTDELTNLATVIENSSDLYSDKDQPLLAIMRATGLHFGLKENDSSAGIAPNIEVLEPLDRLRNIGRVYITVPNARRGTETGRNAIPLIIKHFGEDYSNVSFYGDNINKALDSFTAAIQSKDGSAIRDAIKELGKYINIRSLDIIFDESNNQLHINKFKRGNDGRLVKRTDGRIEYEGKTDFIPTDSGLLKDALVKVLVSRKVRYNVDLARLNDKAYNKSIIESGVLQTYVKKLESRSSWFVLNPIVDGKEETAIPPQMTSQKKPIAHSTIFSNDVKQAPTAPVVNTIKKDTVSYTPTVITYDGETYTLGDGSIIDSSGNKVIAGPTNATLFNLAAAARRPNATYNNRYAVIINEDGLPLIYDMQLGIELDKSSSEYKQIFYIHTSPIRERVDTALPIFSMLDNVSDIEGFATIDLTIYLPRKDLKYGAFIDPVTGKYKANLVMYVGEYKGNKVYGTAEPTYQRNNVVGWQPYLILGNGKAIATKFLGVKNVDSLNASLFNTMLDYINNGKRPQLAEQLDAIIDIIDNSSIKEDEYITTDEPTTQVSNSDVSQIASMMGLGDDIEMYREATETLPVFDKQAEMSWLEKVLPNLATEDRISFFDGLIPIMNSGRTAWGKFDGSMMTISDLAASGTVYHEAFHAVFHMLLDSNKRAEILNEAKKAYGREFDNEELEERLADDFMNYVERSETIFGRITNFFRRLAIKRDNWRVARVHLYSLFRDINNGEYANIKPQSTQYEITRAKQEEYTQEMKDILANAHRDDYGRLLAPNGEPSNLTERQYAQVRTKAFKDWFGDWENDPANSSKVIDENGEPLVTYHTSPHSEFSSFNTSDRRVEINPDGSYDRRMMAFVYDMSDEEIDNAIKDYENNKGTSIYTAKNKDVSSSYAMTEAQMFDIRESQIIDNEDSWREEDGLAEEAIYDKAFDFAGVRDKFTNRIDKSRANVLINKYALSKEEFNKILKEIDEYLSSKSEKFTEDNKFDLFKDYVKEKMKDLRHDYSNDYNSDSNKIIGSQYALFVKMINPLIVDAKGKNWNKILYQGKIESTRSLEIIAKNNGYDGIIVKNVYDIGGEMAFPEVTDVFSVREATSVKSATDNIGTFDNNNPGIKYRLAEENEQYKKYLDIYQRNSAIKSYPTKAQAVRAYNNLKQRYPKARIMLTEGGRISKQLKPKEGQYHVYMNKPRLSDFLSMDNPEVVVNELDNYRSYYNNLTQDEVLSEIARITQEEREQFIDDGHSPEFINNANDTILDILRTCLGINA